MFYKIVQHLATNLDNIGADLFGTGNVYGAKNLQDLSQGERFSELFVKAPDLGKSTKIGMGSELKLLKMSIPLEDILSEEELRSIKPGEAYRSKVNCALIWFEPLPDGSGNMERMVFKRPYKGWSDHFRLLNSRRFYDLLGVTDSAVSHATGFTISQLCDIHLHQGSIRPGALVKLGLTMGVETLKEPKKDKVQTTGPNEIQPDIEVRAS